ncbi:MAG: co-chaperone GroES [Gammaproteobacteria bacterium]|nr:co-chaperone GroES [Gammaproteobacteria bacterium]
MSIRPLHDRVVIRRQEEEATSAGGIVLPGSAAEKPNQGEVLAVGPGRVATNGELQTMSVKVGDKVLFGPYAGNSTAKINGEEVLIVSESEIYGILEA